MSKQMIPTVFERHTSTEYPGRTYANAKKADATIAFAINFGTAGEKCTEKAAKAAQKPFVQVDLRKNIIIGLEDVIRELSNMDYHPDEGLQINVAGNSLPNLERIYTQKQCDELIFQFFNVVMKDSKFTNKIGSFRSGGQTGIDQAGISAGQRLYKPTFVMATADWKFRIKSGPDGDIRDKEQFMARFSLEQHLVSPKSF